MLEIRKEGENSVTFVVRSPQGQPLLESVPFRDSMEVKRTLRELKPRIGSPDSFERQTDHEGKFRFALKGPGGQILGRSHPYTSEAGMENGIRNTQKGLMSGNLE